MGGVTLHTAQRIFAFALDGNCFLLSSFHWPFCGLACGWVFVDFRKVLYYKGLRKCFFGGHSLRFCWFVACETKGVLFSFLIFDFILVFVFSWMHVVR